MRPLIIVDFPTHYTTPLLARLRAQVGAEIICLSEGDQQYWQAHLAKSAGSLAASLDATLCRGRRVSRHLSLNPSLTVALAKRDYDLVLMELSGRAELATAFSITRLRNKPFLLWTGLWTHPSTPFHRATWPLTRTLYRHSDALVVYGSHVRRFLVRSGVQPERVFIAEHAVDNEFYGRPVGDEAVQAFRRQAGADSRPLILAVARLVAQKGLDDLVAAAASVRDLQPVVAIVGTGPLAAQLAAQAAATGVELKLVGGVPPASMPVVYAAADVFVMPSVTSPSIKECWGLAINEAMCQALPVIASDAVGAVAGGLVVDGVTGLVVREHDRSQLAVALRRLLTSPSERVRLGSAGLARVAQTSQAAMADAFQAAFASVFGTDRRSASAAR
ncbi:MAG: glycosyltransferase family 4 protein [Thermoleophilia bacterium]|nr:glycosyltransferase family 4 protein [Thermoleophilia bacterium]